MDQTEELLNKIKELGYVIRQIGYKDQEHADKNIYNYRYWAIPEENHKLKNTPFFFDSEDDFIHFTSIESLFSILNSGHLRLYNLLNMDDKYELEYARKALSFISPDSGDKAKEQTYSFSMCSSSVILNEEPKKKKHLLWKLHGRDGEGVIIRLKIMNDLNAWYNYYLTKCFYDLGNFTTIKELHEITDKEILDAKVGCFIKLPIYEFENEIRLIFDQVNSGWITDKNNNRTYPIIYPDKLHKSNKISYVQLPLYNFFKNDSNAYPVPPNGMQYNYEIPKLLVTEIILGYRYDDNDLKNFMDKITLYDPSIKVRLSDLKQYY
jgi:hypothetical protein